MDYLNNLSGRWLWPEVQERLSVLGLRIVGIDDGRSQLWLELPDGMRLPLHVSMNERSEHHPTAPHNEVVLQPYVNPRKAARYRQRGVFYLDFAGNAWVWTDSVKILIEGKKQEPLTAYSSEQVALSTPSELRFLFMVLNEPETTHLTLRRQSRLAGIALGGAQKANRALADGGYITGDSRLLRRRDELIDMWLAGATTRLFDKLQSRTVSGAEPQDVLAALKRENLPYVPAGEAVSPVMRSNTSLALFGQPPWVKVVRAMKLRPDSDGRITLRESFWNIEEMWITEFGRALLTCAELMASPDERLREAAAEMRQSLS